MPLRLLLLTLLAGLPSQAVTAEKPAEAAPAKTATKAAPDCPVCKKPMVFTHYDALKDEGGAIFKFFACKECKTTARQKRD